MKTSDFDFELPEELIAQTPLERRDASRLLTLDKYTGETGHHHFYELPRFLRPGDCLVLNDSRVLPARLIGRRSTGGACEVLLLIDRGEGLWECLVRPGRKMKPGAQLSFGEGKLTAVRDWLKEHVFSIASVSTPDEWIRAITGEPLDPDYFLTYLERKYSALYELK